MTEQPVTRSWSLYRCRDAEGRLLYVGTTSGRQRWAKHAEESWWWAQVATITVEHFVDRDAALGAERTSIADEQPMHNTQLATYAAHMECGRRMTWMPLENPEARFEYEGLEYRGAWLCEDCCDYDPYTAPPRGAGLPITVAA
jgi:hypothetical protein